MVSQRVCKATGPVPVAMAKGTFVRSESRPMEVLMLKPGIDIGHLIVQDKGKKKKRVWNQHLVADGNIYFEDVVVFETWWEYLLWRCGSVSNMSA